MSAAQLWVQLLAQCPQLQQLTMIGHDLVDFTTRTMPEGLPVLRVEACGAMGALLADVNFQSGDHMAAQLLYQTAGTIVWKVGSGLVLNPGALRSSSDGGNVTRQLVLRCSHLQLLKPPHQTGETPHIDSSTPETASGSLAAVLSYVIS